MSDHDDDQKPERAPRRAAIVLRTPDEWRVVLGTRASHFGCARILHGWTEHEHHEGQPLRLSETAYHDAITAGQSPSLTPTPNALSPHRGRGR